MVEVDILCVVQDGSVINVINVATVGVNTCEKPLEDSIELLIARLQNASSRITEIIENTISVVSCINLNFHFKRKILCLQNLKNKLLCS